MVPVRTSRDSQFVQFPFVPKALIVGANTTNALFFLVFCLANDIIYILFQELVTDLGFTRDPDGDEETF
jgi:hypothetical protein